MCRRASPPPYPFTIFRAGPPCEINITGAFSILVVTERVAAAIEKVGKNEIQRIPVEVDQSRTNWEIVNPLAAVDCLDEQRSQIQSYYPPDFSRPELAGKPRGIITLRIEAQKATNHHVFRISNWMGPVIVSEQVVDAINSLNPEGCRFESVT
jgi:hypothetical protein